MAESACFFIHTFVAIGAAGGASLAADTVLKPTNPNWRIVDRAAGYISVAGNLGRDEEAPEDGREERGGFQKIHF